MKTKPRDSRKLRAAPPVPRADLRPVLWIPFAFSALTAIVVWWAYAPAAHGPFLFDDNTLPFALPEFNAPFSVWVRNLRPVLMASYWMNARLSGDDTYSYHLVS